MRRLETRRWRVALGTALMAGLLVLGYVGRASAALQPTDGTDGDGPARAWYDRPAVTLIVALGGIFAVWVAVQRQRDLVVDLSARVRELTERLEGEEAALADAETSLKQLAVRDSVTGLPNHGNFQDSLRGEWRRALREASPISVVILDIDHFTEYNEEFGHQKGDECLSTVGAKLADLIGRPGDLVARYGGEEFAVLLARTDQQGAFRVAYKLRSAIEELELPHPRSLAHKNVTVSVAVASTTPALDSSWEELELVAAANRAVGEAKTRGRNCVVA